MQPNKARKDNSPPPGCCMSDILRGERQLEDIWDPALDVLLEEGEHGEVEPGPLRIETLRRRHA